MTPEEKSLLEKTHELAVENNAILKSMKRHARMGTVVKFTYWGIIIALSFGAYYFIQPYIKFMTGLGGGETGAPPTSYAQQLQDLLK